LLGLFLGAVLSATFLSQQTHWMQDRLIIVFVPILLFFILGSFYTLIPKYRFIKYILYSILGILMITNSKKLIEKLDKTKYNVFNINTRDKWIGYTLDWQNYLKMSAWCGQNLTKGNVVGTRKPNTSYLYADGKCDFFGLNKSTTDSADDVLKMLSDNHVTHLLLANIRANAAKAIEGNIIGTIHSYAQAIRNQYPEKLKLIHSIGTNEPSQLYQIIY